MQETLAEEVTVVTGLPRSGTSMLMRMLAAGGFPLLTDGRRKADEHNVHGYFEYESVKGIAYDLSWLDAAAGRAVKVVAPLVLHLPADRPYAMLFIRRALGAVHNSQERMLHRSGSELSEPLDWIPLLATLEQQTEAWCTGTQRCRVLSLRYEDVVAAPAVATEAVCAFLGRNLDQRAMVAAVDLPRTPGRRK